LACGLAKKKRPRKALTESVRGRPRAEAYFFLAAFFFFFAPPLLLFPLSPIRVNPSFSGVTAAC
jgi:hypothetical protein